MPDLNNKEWFGVYLKMPFSIERSSELFLMVSFSDIGKDDD
ncbi:MAG: hypothetical protein AB7T22_14295 [Calditrichaceae bacterium]